MPDQPAAQSEMPGQTDGARSRRSVLTAATAGAAALAMSRIIQPATALAAGTALDIDVDNPTTAQTSVTQGTADANAFSATAPGIGAGLTGSSTAGVGVLGTTGPVGLPAVVALQGDYSQSAYQVALNSDPSAPALAAGLYGYSDLDGDGIGALGETGSGVAVVGFGNDAGSLGVLALGSLGAFIEGTDGAFVVSDGNGTGLHVHVGIGSAAPTPPLNTAIYASVDSNTQVGLEAHGRIRFPSRSGRASVAAKKSSVSVNLAGVTSSNFAIATLNTSVSGRYVRAVVCSTNKITIYLNSTVSASTKVAWMVLG